MELSRATLCGWMASCAELLTPLYDLMVKRVLLSIVIHTDDTTVPVLDPTLPKTRTGRFWVYIGDVRNPYVVYDYTPRRTRDGPERFLKGFRGYLQADAFSGYDRICAGPGVKEVACWAHVRRKFFESRTSAPVLAHAALARIRQLYKIESAAEEFSAEDRRALRQRDSVPLLTAFGEWLTEQGRLALPKSPIGQAIAYAQSNWAALCRYPEHGELSIDNVIASYCTSCTGFRFSCFAARRSSLPRIPGEQLVARILIQPMLPGHNGSPGPGPRGVASAAPLRDPGPCHDLLPGDQARPGGDARSSRGSHGSCGGSRTRPPVKGRPVPVRIPRSFRISAIWSSV